MQDSYCIRINQDLKIVLQKISETIPHIKAIVLYGGYGRGEGSWIETDDNIVLPYNDYDIAVISNCTVSRDIIKSIEQITAKEIGIRWVDISVISENKLKAMSPTIFNFDLKYASKIIWGDLNVLDLIPTINAWDIGLIEAEKLFYTRLWTFLGSLDEDAFEKKNLDIDEARFFKNQMAKAILAVLDVLLLKKKDYVSSYKEKLIKVEELYPNKDWVKTVGKWALQEKLKPSSEKMNQNEVSKLYNEVYRIYLTEMKEVLSNYYKFGFKDYKSLTLNYIFMPYYLTRRIWYVLIRRSYELERNLKINKVQTLIFFSYNYGNIDPKLFPKTIKELKKLDQTVIDSLTWNEARVKIAKIRNEV
jgi:hypothetical protein